MAAVNPEALGTHQTRALEAGRTGKPLWRHLGGHALSHTGSAIANAWGYRGRMQEAHLAGRIHAANQVAGHPEASMELRTAFEHAAAIAQRRKDARYKEWLATPGNVLRVGIETPLLAASAAGEGILAGVRLVGWAGEKIFGAFRAGTQYLNDAWVHVGRDALHSTGRAFSNLGEAHDLRVEARTMENDLLHPVDAAQADNELVPGVPEHHEEGQE